MSLKMLFRANFLLITLLGFQTVYSKSIILDKDNFHKELKNGIAFVLFTNPTGDRSKELNPVWRDMALKFSGLPGVKIAEIDCGSDDHGSPNRKFCKSTMVRKLMSIYLPFLT